MTMKLSYNNAKVMLTNSLSCIPYFEYVQNIKALLRDQQLLHIFFFIEYRYYF